MKKLLFLLILSLFTNCISRKNTEYILRGNYFLTKAKFFDIETKNGIHIFHFKNDSIEGVFTKVVDTAFANKNYRKIKLHKNYTLFLQKQMYSGHHRTTLGSMTISNIVVWDEGMNSEFFEDCENITGNQINPRFTLIKYIAPELSK
ncbi:hypothetical protein [Chryseobacterium sp. Leaf394]|uniref:hypothetical protein n=1 Tax=Chryseobacterium sp. Leaf394 TaxID=1736361 RepID=UPI0007016D24|nr:hypothetical protein [Chryseobacterium sp. Leaf394]KQS92291.1 hypothetical protein ASG21_07560 [Chryseobacterium sp. Leaf394]